MKMKQSTFRKSLGALLVALVALAVGAASAPASAAPVPTSSGATVSGLTATQQAAKKRELRRCSKLRPLKKARACKRKVIARYNKLASAPPPIGKTWTVDVGPGGDFYAPSMLNIKLNDAINWSWARINGSEPHNVTFLSGPAGIDRNAFASQLTSAPSYRFKRQFVKAGAYSFICNIHFDMTMSVNVTR